MKLVRLFSRFVLVSLVAAAFAGLAVMYGTSAHPALPKAHGQAEPRDSWPSAPGVAYFSDFLGYSSLLAVFCLAGRVVFRLRLTSVPRGEGPVLLDLRREGQRSLTSSPTLSDAGPPTP